MTQISATLVQALRHKTGVGMMDCKKALTATGGDMEKAVHWLREQGLARAAQKSGRAAHQGLVGIYVEGGRGVLVEVSSETDFVARNAQFQTMTEIIAKQALQVNGDKTQLLHLSWPDKEHTVEDEIRENILSIGENLSLRRSASIEADFLGQYAHGAVAPGMGRIGVLVGLRSKGKAAPLAALGKNLAMHIAATAPLAVTVEELDPQFLERERALFIGEAEKSGKPPEIVAKMVEGRLRKLYQDVVLLKQVFVIDGERTVAQAIQEAETHAEASIQVSGFLRYAVGEGAESDG